jgi:hypothetical protein
MALRFQVAVVLASVATTSVICGTATDPGPTAVNLSSVVLAFKSAVPTPEPSTASPSLVSSTVAAEIISGIPAYKPGATGTAAAGPTGGEKPKNDIPRLPVEILRKYEVRESRIPVFRTLDLYTEEGLTALAFKEHPGFRIGNIFNLNAPAAHERIVNEQLFAARLDLVDTAFAMATGGDTREIEAMRQDIIEDGFNKDSPVGR